LLLVAVAIVFIVVHLLNNNNSRVRMGEAHVTDAVHSDAKAGKGPTQLSGHHQQPQFGIVIDAGSSGSRIHIFRFNSPRDPDGLPLIHWPAAASLKQTPGLSTFAEPLAASRTLHPLLAFAAEHVRKPRLVGARNKPQRFANVSIAEHAWWFPVDCIAEGSWLVAPS